MWWDYVAYVALGLLCVACVFTDAEQNGREFTHEWAVRVQGGERHARDVAESTGFSFVQPVS